MSEKETGQEAGHNAEEKVAAVQPAEEEAAAPAGEKTAVATAGGATDPRAAGRGFSTVDGSPYDLPEGMSFVNGKPDAQFVFVIDPEWKAEKETDEPPPEAVVGGWMFDENGDTERFVPNPYYKPSRPDIPTDPVDAAMHTLVRDGGDGAELLAVMRDAAFGVAVDEEGTAIVAAAPDGKPSLLVTTAYWHRQRVDAAGWVEVPGPQLAEVLPDEGVDVLLNPGAPASMRIDAPILKESLLGPDPDDE